ncbi:MAG: c-type cytochrome [Acidobacteria bacterium]|nr:c-type cytochrome [Acidobacteriota bacterium]
MNYPVWDIPASGLLIAFIAIVHVFVSHFAVGGGLFLVLTERRARRTADEELLGYVKGHSRFFILLTLVFGAITGVGIWFTIGLVHPQATSSLINTFVWGWAIEWTFFLTEIAAAMVYYYGWDRLSARTHMAVGWVYFAAAWLSLVVINGILTYMLTPGAWVASRGFWDGFFNETYWPALVTRTCVAVGLAGMYAIWTAAWLQDTGLKARIARLAGWTWVVPMAVAIPVSLVWYLRAAAGAGVPVAEIFGARDAGVPALLGAIFGTVSTGYPMAQRAAWWVIVSAIALLVLTLVVVTLRIRTFGRPAAAAILVLGLVAMGGSEWVREDLRKPYVIGHYMFVNGVRLPEPDGVARPPADAIRRFGADRFTVDALNTTGVLAASAWVRPVPDDLLAPSDQPARVAHQGRELFRSLCASCHTLDGYLAIRPLVRGKSADALYGVLARLATPVDGTGAAVAWNAPGMQVKTWRNRRMPPFVGTDDERRILASHLAVVGGSTALMTPVTAAPADVGKTYFDTNCAACHAADGIAPFDHEGRRAPELYDMIGRLPAVNEMMPAFEGTDEQRRALSEYLASLPRPAKKGGGQ